MKKIFFTITFLCIFSFTQAAMWVNGNNTLNVPPFYGQFNIPSASATPGARSGSAVWRGRGNEVFMYGGVGGVDGTSLYSDLWLINGTQWSWVGGSTQINRNPSPSTPLVQNATASPGGRQRMGAALHNQTSNMYFFGGMTQTGVMFNDLWILSEVVVGNNTLAGIRNWTFVSGNIVANDPGNYGVQGVPSFTNMPPARCDACSWVTSNGDFYVFGGYSPLGTLNDLWRMRMVLNSDNITMTPVWTWLSGSNVADAFGVYGTQGFPAASNTPGARFGASCFVDRNDNLYLFGGLALGIPGTSYLSKEDFWQFNTTNGMWTWISGSNSSLGAAIAPALGVISSTPPAGRYYASSWSDINSPSYSYFWVFGGLAIQRGAPLDSRNDLWRIQVNFANSTGNTTNIVGGGYPLSASFVWMGGFGNGIYGVQGVDNTNNFPPKRLQASSWVDLSGTLWLFGGTNQGGANPPFGRFNDLWRLSSLNGTTIRTTTGTGAQTTEIVLTGLAIPFDSPYSPGVTVAIVIIVVIVFLALVIVVWRTTPKDTQLQ